MENLWKKGIFGSMPKVGKCCFCIKNLKVASAIIAVWSVLIGYHELLITFRPGCSNLYKEGQYLTMPLKLVAGVLFTVNILMISSAIIFFISIFLTWNLSGDFFLFFGAASGITSVAFAVLYLAQLFTLACYSNASDIITLFIYSVLWIYFILVVNSHRRCCNRPEENPGP